jgi:Ca2+-binding EF-hand superfamily protein
MFDNDKSGSISSSELKSVVETLGIQTTASELRELMQLMDKDGESKKMP